MGWSISRKNKGIGSKWNCASFVHFYLEWVSKQECLALSAIWYLLSPNTYSIARSPSWKESTCKTFLKLTMPSAFPCFPWVPYSSAYPGKWEGDILVVVPLIGMYLVSITHRQSFPVTVKNGFLMRIPKSALKGCCWVVWWTASISWAPIMKVMARQFQEPLAYQFNNIIDSFT